jgi:cytochrome c peroxidase
VRLVPCAASAVFRRRKTSTGLATVDRNSPSLLDVRFARWFGRDGGSDSLWAHALRPLA